ncbi:ATP-binding protein [Desulfopila aestuarii]|uniref:histidine kinase n=1 Tax=Desulfopila aestuarii DSM 18488 TaxID=1121416 RepID=A0A1M7YKB8_9BACT|nr:ATP-binding protein [Desulfopila aestuarii]SHO53075.1 PAS domain S-box-containing protein [Desulfopila aestuarii DSM 18488]
MSHLTKVVTVTAVIIVGIVLFFQAWVLNESRQRTLQLIETRAANRAQSTADRIAAVFSRFDSGLLAIRDVISAEEIINGPSPATREREAEMRTLLKHWQDRMPKVERVHVASAEGQFVYSNLDSVPTQTIYDRPYFQEQRQAQDDLFRLSETYFSRVAHEWGLLVSRRIQTTDGRFAGIVIFTISAESLKSEMTAVDQSQWFFVAFDKNRMMVASNPMNAEWLGKTFDDQLVSDGLQNGRASMVGQAFGMEPARIWSACQVGKLPLLMVAGFLEPLALTQWWRDVKLHLFVAALLVAGCTMMLIVQRRNDLAAQNIRSLHERMRLATNSAKLGVWELERNTNHVVCDETTAKLMQLPPDVFSFTTEQWLANVLQEDRLHLHKVICQAGSGFLEERVRITLARNIIRHLKLSGLVQGNNNSKTIKVVGVMRDVTEDELMTHRLQVSEEYFRTLFDAVPHAIAVIEGGVVVDSNHPYREMFEIEASETRPPWLMAAERQANGDESEEAGRRLYEGALSGVPQETNWYCQRVDGTMFEAELRARLFPHEGRKLVVVTVRDLTEQRAMENALHQSQKLDALGQLAGGVAHDFNNMLSAILGSAELLSPEYPVELQKGLRDTIISAAGRAAKLTSKLLSFARKGKYLSTPVDVHEIVKETIALLERTIDRRIMLSMDLGATQSRVVGDPSQLQSALLNLGVNARDAMPSGGSLIISTRNVVLEDDQCTLGGFAVIPGDYVHITVTDTGEGIAPEVIQNVFEPFFTTKEVGKGTGLGLAAVFGTMASHHGAVTVDSEIGKGSRFSLYLPVVSAEQASTQSEPEPLISGSGLVLVIDDEELVLVSTVMQLESLGYTTIALGEPEKAAELFLANQAELVAVLVDMVMPKFMGLEIAEQLRKVNPNVPIVLMSGFPRTAQLDQWLGRTIDGFLQKPFNQVELGKLLSQVRARFTESDL